MLICWTASINSRLSTATVWAFGIFFGNSAFFNTMILRAAKTSNCITEASIIHPVLPVLLSSLWISGKFAQFLMKNEEKTLRRKRYYNFDYIINKRQYLFWNGWMQTVVCLLSKQKRVDTLKQPRGTWIWQLTEPALPTHNSLRRDIPARACSSNWNSAIRPAHGHASS